MILAMFLQSHIFDNACHLFTIATIAAVTHFANPFCW
jgi:hypothetical protein